MNSSWLPPSIFVRDIYQANSSMSRKYLTEDIENIEACEMPRLPNEIFEEALLLSNY